MSLQVGDRVVLAGRIKAVKGDGSIEVLCDRPTTAERDAHAVAEKAWIDEGPLHIEVQPGVFVVNGKRSPAGTCPVRPTCTTSVVIPDENLLEFVSQR